jgi:hypothetical protein
MLLGTGFSNTGSPDISDGDIPKEEESNCHNFTGNVFTKEPMSSNSTAPTMFSEYLSLPLRLSFHILVLT